MSLKEEPVSFSPFAADNPAAPKRRISNAARRRVHARERRVRRTQKAARAQLPTGYPDATATVPAWQTSTTHQVQAQPYHQPTEYAAYHQPTEQHAYHEATEYQAPPANQPINQQPTYQAGPPQPYQQSNPWAA